MGFDGRIIRLAAAAIASVSLLVAQAPQQGKAAPQGPAPAGIITGVGNFSHIVADVDKAAAFYRDVIGLDVNQAPGAFAGTPAIMDLGNTPGAQSRVATFRVPGAQFGLELIEYKDIQRVPAARRFQDPGSANLVLTVRDLDAIVARVRKSAGRIQTIGGQPTTIPGAKVIFLQDPDGFFIELSQRDTPTTAPSTSNVIGGSVEIIIENADRTLKFWHDILKFDTAAPTAFDGSKDMVNTAGTPGAQFRRITARIPGSTVTLIMLEFKDIDRRRLESHTQDPGTPILQLRTADVDAVTAAWKTAGGEVISKGGVPAAMGAAKLVLLRDPNGVMVEVLPGPAAGKGK
jgi:catechol 2,3-dioxygenase-like lactoylglutathione lyase family enzyme